MKKLFVSILSVLSLIFCKPESEQAFLQMETTNLTFLSVPGSETIPVNTNRPFTATSSREWCMVTQAGSQLKITVTENGDEQERTAFVMVSAGGVPGIRVDVKQAGKDPFFTIDPDRKTQQFDSYGGTRLLTVDANVPFTAASGQSWCLAEVVSGVTNNLRITVAENTIINPRTAEVVISAEGFEDLVISVDQEGRLANKQGMTIKGWVSCNNAGVPDVVVSDGYEVTVTDANGVYYLPSEKRNKQVFISVPGNYEVPCQGRAPRFFQKLTEAGNVAERHDFELTPVDNSRHVVLAMADLHLANRINDIAQFEKCLADINGLIAGYQASGTKVYALTLGDLTWDTYWYPNHFTLTQYLPYMNRINAPVFNTIGNHDNDPYAAGDWASQQFFRDVLGPS